MQIGVVALTRAGIVLSMLFSLAAAAGEEDDIVSSCHFSNAEWGMDMIDRCIRDNQATRASLLQYPEQYQRFLNRCRTKSELGWDKVKNCVDKDIEADAALKQYPAEKGERIAYCEAEYGGRGRVVVKACVDGEAAEASEKQK
jgi:hypothetical protein